MAKRASASNAHPRLATYHRKRRLAQSGEPAGGRAAQASPFPTYVIQKHDATRLHFDFRLEMEGTLRSWAVPKGLPTRIGQRVLAVEVEDHPLDYGKFEGVIPEGNYGAGPVMLWDRGIYTVGGGDPVRAYREGKIHLGLVGEKCRGEWTLVRLKEKEKDNDRHNWLLLKNRDANPKNPGVSKTHREMSVLSGRSMDEIRSGQQARHAPVPKPEKPAAARRTSKISVASTEPTANAEFIEPMKALAVDSIPEGDWQLELKFDGYRALAVIKNGEVKLWSRNRISLSADYPEVIAALKSLTCEQAVLDGEVVAVDANGHSRFQLLQNRSEGPRPPIHYYVFDLLSLNGRSLLKTPLEERQFLLRALLPKKHSGVVRISPSFDVKPAALLDQVRRLGLEGIVAKRLGSTYEPGRRSGAWLKCRVAREQEFVIGGYTPPQGGRNYFGALLVGYYEGKRFLYAGKVGTGFNERLLASLHHSFEKIRSDKCPFVNLPLTHASRFGTPMNARTMKTVQWLKPKLICQVRFVEWTHDGLLRQPVFLGLRADKPAVEVVREAEATPGRRRIKASASK
ncbi:non-homologous end-joining DNA ligase [Oleiharenicola lentus]|uniref:non-homologous end-joining DNA ligase n=1 Tax=Oleiharenicola lentus TaxID=2508720 RepID=UPI003F6631F1